MSDIGDAFVRYDQANPKIYEMFDRFTREAIDAGRRTLSATLIFERVRWESHIKTDETFKMSNNYRPYYARKFMDKNPQFAGVFNTKPAAGDDRFYG